MKDEPLNKIFQKIADRVDSRKESLSQIKSLQKQKKTTNMGIEGWLKVETAYALEGKIEKLQNRGADVILNVKDEKGNFIEIELKAMSNFSLTENSLNKNIQADNYLFLADAENNRWETIKSFKTWDVVDKHIFNDNVGDWILFMIKKKK